MGAHVNIRRLLRYRDHDGVCRCNSYFDLEDVMRVYVIEFAADPVSTLYRSSATASCRTLRITVADDFKAPIPHSVLPFMLPKPANG
jgi:hypothetical protein